MINIFSYNNNSQVVENICNNVVEGLGKSLINYFKSIVNDSIHEELKDFTSKLNQLEMIKKQISTINKKVLDISGELKILPMKIYH